MWMKRRINRIFDEQARERDSGLVLPGSEPYLGSPIKRRCIALQGNRRESQSPKAHSRTLNRRGLTAIPSFLLLLGKEGLSPICNPTKTGLTLTMPPHSNLSYLFPALPYELLSMLMYFLLLRELILADPVLWHIKAHFTPNLKGQVQRATSNTILFLVFGLILGWRVCFCTSSIPQPAYRPVDRGPSGIGYIPSASIIYLFFLASKPSLLYRRTKKPLFLAGPFIFACKKSH